MKDGDNVTPEMVLACIAKGMGFKKISLSRENAPTQVEAGVNLSKSVNLVKIAIETVYKIAIRLRLVSIAAKLKLAIEAIEKLSRLIDDAFFEYDQIDVDEVLPKQFCKCKGVPDGNIDTGTTETP